MPPSVLVVGDEPNIVFSLKYLLRQIGYDVCVARDGRQALDSIAQARPGLVLLDMAMSRRDGADMCRTVRANPDWADIRIVMLTARGRQMEPETGLVPGADDYITMPLSTRDVVETVRRFLGTP